MKKAFLSLSFVLMTIGAFAQNNQNTISVGGLHKYGISPEYKANMVISMSNVYYDVETMTYSSIKSAYLDKLAKVGISSDRLTENELQYLLSGYDKEGTIMVFTTRSLDEMNKFLKVKSAGVTKSDTNLIVEMTDDQMAEYAKMAYDNAKQKAEALAKKIGRSVGKAVSISDSNSNKIYDSMYYGYGNSFDSKEYHISVSFELL
ncbi:MAG: SIMPL domain-containing protein [Aurantibacter sp.]